MTYTGGIDIGSTYVKAIIAAEGGRVAGRSLMKTGFRLSEAADRALQEALERSELSREQVAYVATTGFGRFQYAARDVNTTDLTAAAWGVRSLFPNTRTILDVGGLTMKATRLTEQGQVKSFRLNDKCAAGTGAFLEKTARYLGFTTEEIGPLAATSKEPVPISGVCAVFAESEVINHLSQGSSPADIMHGAIVSLVDRSVQLMKRVQMEPEFTLIGGILRFETMARVIRERLGSEVNVPPGEEVQYVAALGAARLAHRRLRNLSSEAALGEAVR